MSSGSAARGVDARNGHDHKLNTLSASSVRQVPRPHTPVIRRRARRPTDPPTAAKMAPAFVTGAVLPRSGLSFESTAVSSAPTRPATSAPGRSQIISMSKNAQLKAAKKSNRRRPKKHCPSDINRAPPTYDPTPLMAEGLPAAYTIVPESAFTGKVMISVADIEKYNATVTEAEEAASTDAENKRVTARTQSKTDRAAAVKVKQAAHVAHKEAREAAIKAFADATAADEAAQAVVDEEATEEDAPAAEDATEESAEPAAEA